MLLKPGSRRPIQEEGNLSERKKSILSYLACFKGVEVTVQKKKKNPGARNQDQKVKKIHALVYRSSTASGTLSHESLYVWIPSTGLQDSNRYAVLYGATVLLHQSGSPPGEGECNAIQCYSIPPGQEGFSTRRRRVSCCTVLQHSTRPRALHQEREQGVVLYGATALHQATGTTQQSMTSSTSWGTSYRVGLPQ